MHHQQQPFNMAVAALAGADAANMAGSVPVAKQRDSEQSVMLRMDDEVSGLVEAAATPADQAGAHSTKPEPMSTVSGELPGVQSRLAAAAFFVFIVTLAFAVLCSAVNSSVFKLALQYTGVTPFLFCLA